MICGEMKVTDAPMIDRLNFTLGGSTKVNVIADKMGSLPVSGPSTTRSVPVRVPSSQRAAHVWHRSLVDLIAAAKPGNIGYA
jgi:hypothetical protein